MGWFVATIKTPIQKKMAPWTGEKQPNPPISNLSRFSAPLALDPDPLVRAATVEAVASIRLHRRR
jgi:hypothetical protein